MTLGFGASKTLGRELRAQLRLRNELVLQNRAQVNQGLVLTAGSLERRFAGVLKDGFGDRVYFIVFQGLLRADPLLGIPILVQRSTRSLLSIASSFANA